MNVFAVLAEPVRRSLVETLASGEHTVAELTDIAMHDFGITRTAISHHLRILRDQRLVITRQEGGSRVYRLHPGAVDRIEREVHELRRRWNARSGWPYLVDPPGAPRPHRLGRAGLRGRGHADDIWQHRQARLVRDDPERPWLSDDPWRSDEIEDESDGEHRWVAEGAVPRPDVLGF